MKKWPKIISISGKARHGKDTFASMLAKNLEDMGYSTQVIKFGDPVKKEAKDIGWNGKKDEEGRALLQEHGNKMREEVDKAYWIKKVEASFEDVCFVLIPDTRYENEATYFSKNGYDQCVIRVVRFEDLSRRTIYDNGLTPEQKNHPSETELDGRNDIFNFVVEAENMVDLKNSADTIADTIRESIN